MSYRIQSQEEHDLVIKASSGTYTQLIAQGYKVSINPGAETNQSVGQRPNVVYPDVIVWTPNPENPSSGTAAIIEEIETEESVTLVEAAQWKVLGDLGAKFILIVPASKTQLALALAQQAGARVSEIWYYEKRNGQYAFTKYFAAQK